MPKSVQAITYTLPSVTVSAGGNTTVPLSDLPKSWNGRIAHLAELHFKVAITPTFTTAPTTVGVNNTFKACEVWDGSFSRFVGGFNELRAIERLHSGRNRIPDADTNTASASARYFHRVWFAGPPNFEGAPADFAIPCGMLSNGEVRVTQGALTDISADTTVLTGTVIVVAKLVLFDEVRLPPAYQVLTQSVTGSDLSLQGRALYECLALFDSAAFGAFTAGDLGAISLEGGQGNIVNGTAPEVLSVMYQSDWAAGELGTFSGQPYAASDDNGKMVDHASPLALIAAPYDLQPVLWSGPDHRISKLHLAEASLHLSWSGGSQSTAKAIFGRILPQPRTVMQQNAGRALARLDGRTAKGGGVKTLSKKEYVGPYGEFMPWTAKV